MFESILTPQMSSQRRWEPYQQGNRTPKSCVLLTGHFFIYFSIFLFFMEGNFFLKKKCVPVFLFLSRCTLTFGILWFNVFHHCKVVIMTKTRCYIEVL
jgi:hypothetical protein